MILGTVLYRSDFCMAAILRDVFLFKDTARLRHLFLAVVLTLFLFLLLRAVGLSPADPYRGYGIVSLMGVGGGLIFGFGMVLAGGCVMSSLYKMASGNLSYVLVFFGMILGSMLYAELFPWLQEVERSLSLAMPASLFELWPRAMRWVAWTFIALAALLFVQWQRKGYWHLRVEVAGYLQPWLAALCLACISLALYLFSSVPLGISSGYAELAGFLGRMITPEHVASLEYFSRSEAMHLAEGRRYGEVVLMAGVVFGAFVNAVALREFHVSPPPPLSQCGAAFAGGLLIALGARMAQGCNFKHLLGGLPLLSVQSLLFALGLILGVWLGARILPRLLLR
ncbi:hypothetical protein GFER_16380 [Geoalkalibacter ferrihydriticus DSM 17813]|uniref:Uncharacterized protein n=1 Tax=Geoalkalibacter ferrihydriticus DSM 17813 TaxID=1121915 RepID=A0A0C2EAF7_9BACT|nr:hypothetical protein GFER_16380 [Geoalkalibacter ferrihydriticus DSM 17813]